jgi:hypothetical protein
MKKLEATKRAVHIEYKYTSGGIVIVADAATFELIKHASIAYYEACPELVGEAFIQKQTDKSKNANVQLTIKVVEKNNVAYTVNLYLTTCKLLVNGKNPENFLDRDISNIHRYINSTTCNDKKLNVNKLNEILKEQLETVLDITGNNTSQNTANVRHSNDIA